MNRTQSITPPTISPLDRARQVESDLKRALYSAFERVQATKAALYLASQYAPDSAYEIVTSYAYDPGDRARIDHRDVIVSRLQTSHMPVIVNGIGTDAQAAEILFRQHNERLLALPIFGRMRRLIGIVDLRDKLGRKPFDGRDVVEAETICEDIRSVLSLHNLYGVGPVALVENPAEPNTAQAPVLHVRRETSAPIPVTTDSGLSRQASSVILRARDRMQKRGLGSESRRRFVTTEEAGRMAMLMPGALAIPGAVAVSLTVTNGQWIASTGPLTDEALSALRPKTTGTAVTATVTVIGDGTALGVERLRTMASAAVAAHTVDQVTLAVAFERQPDDAVKRKFAEFVDTFGETVAAAIGHSAWSAQREAVALRLIEPDLQKYSELSDHSHLVSGIAERFAKSLGLPADAVETIRLASLVHDVGLRLLDYERLVGSVELSAEHQKALHEHPLVGATIVEPVLGTEIAEAVLRHHERWDGQGYPGRLSGTKIPLAARIIAIADAWASIRAPWAYAPRTGGATDAVACLRADAGTQFDPSLVGTFLANLHEIDP